MKKIGMGFSAYFRRLEGTEEWYGAVNYDHGDLDEAEQLFREGKAVNGRLARLVKYPEGDVYDISAKGEGTYCGEPSYIGGGIFWLHADFPADVLRILRFDTLSRTVDCAAELRLSETGRTDGMILLGEELRLARLDLPEETLEFLWPEAFRVKLEPTETPDLVREGELYCTRWYEDPEYRDELVIRSLPDGQVIRRLPGTVYRMPRGEVWYVSC